MLGFRDGDRPLPLGCDNGGPWVQLSYCTACDQAVPMWNLRRSLSGRSGCYGVLSDLGGAILSKQFPKRPKSTSLTPGTSGVQQLWLDPDQMAQSCTLDNARGTQLGTLWHMR